MTEHGLHPPVIPARSSGRAAAALLIHAGLTLALVACREAPTVSKAASRLSDISAAVNEIGTFTSIDVPGALSTSAYGINDRGDIVGGYEIEIGIKHGFLLIGGEFTKIDFPGAFHTNVLGINDRGDIVGTYRNSPTAGNHGFRLSGGEFTTIDFPGSVFTLAADISPEGTVVGRYNSPDNRQHGFLLHEGNYTTLDFPDPGVTTTQVWAINMQGDIVGRADGACCRGFVRSGDAWRFIDYPGDHVWFTEARGINARGEIVGGYSDDPKPGQIWDGFHGYVISPEGVFTSLDFPGAYGTFTGKINSRGDIVGNYWEKTAVVDGRLHGYVLTRAGEK